MGAATGVEVEALDVDQPDRALGTFGKEARAHTEPLEIGDLGGPVRDRPRSEDLFGDGPFEAIEVVPVKARQVELDIAPAVSEVKGRRAPAEVPQRDCCQHMLAGVLLHMVPAPRPVELEPNRTLGHRLREEMVDSLSSLLHIENLGITEQPVVGWLATPFRIKQGVGENREGPVILLADVDNLGLELGQVAVAVKGCFTHHSSRFSATALGPSA
jgi:hypothetical protein